MDYDDAIHGRFGDRPDFSDVEPYARKHVGLEDSPLDKLFEITVFPRSSAQTKKQRTISLRELKELIQKQVAPTKFKLPWLKAAVFGDKRSPLRPHPDGSGRMTGNSYRTNENLQKITGVEVDYDGEVIAADQARSILFGAGVTGIIYETPSSSPTAPRWRCLTPTSASLSGSKRKQLVARLNGIFGGVLDDASFTLSQAFLFGNIEAGARVAIHLVEGVRYVDQADDLDQTAKWKRGKDRHENGAPEGETVDDTELLKGIWKGETYHTAAISLAARWANAGVPPIEAMERLQQAFNEVPEAQRDARWKSRFASLPEILVYCYGKRAEELFAEQNRWRDLLKDEDVPAPRLEFLSPEECSVGEHRKYVIKRFLAEGDIGCIVGAPGVGKSLLAPAICFAVAQGSAIFGMRTKPGKVLYVAAEDEFGMRMRFAALLRTLGKADALKLVTGVSNLLVTDSDDLRELQHEVDVRRPSLICIDTLAMAFPGLEENSAEGMGRVVAVARSLANAGAAVLLIHHDTKDGANGLPRGHSLLNGALDVSMHLTRVEGQVQGKLTKNRNGSTETRIAFDIATVPMGIDEDGDEITAALCREVAASDVKKSVHLAKSAKAALSVLFDLLKSHGLTNHRKQRGVEEDIWRHACVDGRSVSSAEDVASRRKAFGRAVAALIDAKKVEFCDGAYWLSIQAASSSEEFSDGPKGDGLV